MASYEDQLAAEVATWCIVDPKERGEKLQRETIRHPKLIRDLQLHRLDTGSMDLLEIGGGPEPVSDLLPFKSRKVIDPCTDEYRRFFPVPDHVNMEAEDFHGKEHHQRFDLVICTNALDHVRNYRQVLVNVVNALRPGGYFAVMAAENNALTNPHPCHTINLTAQSIHQALDYAFETVWELTYQDHDYRYGWVKYHGRRGQPAFALLMRKCEGYR